MIHTIARTSALLLTLAVASAADLPPNYLSVRPSQLDPRVKQFDDPNVIFAGEKLGPAAPLAVFLPGTSGKPENVVGLMRVVAGQGYRVIGLEYDDEPAVVQLCPQDPDPECAAKFREMRITGAGSGPVTNPVAEAIVPRLVALLRALDRAQPKTGWAGYLDGDQPRWSRITVSGLSQGAGMAAYIAKQHAVRRVVLFSSPWEFTGADRHPVPWLSRPSATPPERWFAEYHAREKTVPLIVAAYAKLAIPAANVRVFDRDLPRGVDPAGANPYHGITVRDPRYADDWRALYGDGR